MVTSAKRLPARQTRATKGAWSFLLVGVLLLIFFLLLPFLLAVGMSFTSLRLISPIPARFIGLENYIRIFNDQAFQQALRNNTLFTVLVVPLQTSLALLLAILVNQPLRGVKLLRTIYFAPLAMAIPAAATIWKLLYVPDTGLINGLLGRLSGGLIQPNWLRDPNVALIAVMLVGMWQSSGFQMIIFLAGLQDIPAELYEAAGLDGAGGWAQFCHITLPSLRNTLIFVLTVTTIYAFRLFDTVYIMTNGGPLGSTDTMLLEMYTVGLKKLQIGRGSAIALVFFLIVLTISLIQRAWIREEGDAS